MLPIEAAEASSRVLLLLVPPVTTPVNPNPGSSTSRLLPVPPNETAVPGRR